MFIGAIETSFQNIYITEFLIFYLTHSSNPCLIPPFQYHILLLPSVFSSVVKGDPKGGL